MSLAFFGTSTSSSARAESNFMKLSMVAEPGWFSKAEIVLGRSPTSALAPF